MYLRLSWIKFFFFFSRTKLYFLNCRFCEWRLWPIGFLEVCLPISVCTLHKFATYYRHYIESVQSSKIDGRRGEWGSELSCEKKRDKADRPPTMMMAHRVFFNVAFLQYFLPYSITVHFIAICSAPIVPSSRRLSSVIASHVNETFMISRKWRNIKVMVRERERQRETV